MLIGIDASRATAAKRTGTENYSLFLIRALLKLDKGHDYRLYFRHPPSPHLFDEAANTELRVMPFLRLWTHIRLSLEMATRTPDVLFVPAHVLPLVHPARSVVTVHDLGYLSYPQAHPRWARWYLEWSTRHNARTAAHVIADSQATKRDLVEYGYATPDKVTVVYPGYDETFAPVLDSDRLASIRQRYDLPDAYIVHVGTLQPRKNLAGLLDARAELTRKARPTHLAIAGKKGWLYESLFARVRQLRLQDTVHFLGYVPQQDLPALITGARVFVLPSFYEGFGLPVLEAMACGTPVICSDVSSLPEVAGDAAVLVPPHDTEQLVQALRRLLDDHALRRRLGQKGLHQVSRFSWEKCAQQTLRILEAVAKMPRRS